MRKFTFVKIKDIEMSFRLCFCFLFMMAGFITARAQTENQKGHIIVLQDSSIELLLRRNAALNESRQSMPGYRIQIYFGPDRTKASEIKTEFRKDHSDIESYLVYHQPNFKVRVGDFKTRLEAVKAIQLI